MVACNISTYNAKTGFYNDQVLVQKLNNNGTKAWVVKQLLMIGSSACFDHEYNILVAGAYSSVSLYQTQKPLLFKLSAQARPSWKDIFDKSNKNDIYYFTGRDATGNVYANVQTDTISFNNNPRILTIKYNASGKRVGYRKELNGTITLPHYDGDFSVNKAGTSYLAGTLNKSDADND